MGALSKMEAKNRYTLSKIRELSDLNKIFSTYSLINGCFTEIADSPFDRLMFGKFI